MMKRMIVGGLIALLGGTVWGGQDETRSPHELKVLMIGNSFSICCLDETPAIAKSLGVKLDLASLYIGGCSLERHWNNVVAATNAAFKPYRYDRIEDGVKTVVKGEINIPEALTAAKWDVVTIQQASHDSWKPETYHPWGDDLVAKIRELAPQAKIMVQETWSYPPWDRRLVGFGLDPVDMYARLHDAYREFAGLHGLDIIPTGTAAMFAPDRDALFTRPDFHFNGCGTYLQGLVWVGKLFGIDVSDASYRPSGIDSARAKELRSAAREALLGRTGARRAFRPARVTRGNTNIISLQPIDRAKWLWMPGDAGIDQLGERVTGGHPGGAAQTEPVFLRFRKVFEVAKGDGTLVFDVSADERFYLTLDGRFVARGPNRSTVENWQYNTYLVDLEPGEHVLEATVWKTGDKGPLAQLSWRGGFVLKAGGAFDAKLTTGVAEWEVGRIDGIVPAGADNGVWGTGSQWEITGSGFVAREPAEWTVAEVVRGEAGYDRQMIWGARTNGWMLFPSQLPDQLERSVGLPGRCAAVAADVPWRDAHVFTEAEAAEKLDLAKTVTVPAHTRRQVAWDLGRYLCAYPVVTLGGGKGARVSYNWSEASLRTDDGLKGGEEGARNLIVGRKLGGYGDTFVSDGRERGVFTTPWFRCGKWLRVDIETRDEPLTITTDLVESRYPLELEGEFSSPQDETLADIRRIGSRAMQMCAHEMLFDCPYYEQQMYPGDTRVQLNVLSAFSRDERMIRRAIELYDLATRDDGMCPFNWPTRGTQEGGAYTLCYLLMYGDYVRNHGDENWLRARLPGYRKSLAGLEFYENAEGLLEDLPGWNFMDWVVGWDADGTAPASRFREGLNAEINLFWLLVQQGAAQVEAALGHDLQSRYWAEKAAKLKLAVVKRFWRERQGLFSDSAAGDSFSEHAQCLALLADVLPRDASERLFAKLVEANDLRRCTVYFSFYLFECYFKFRRGDLFLKRLDLWRDYVKKGLTTTQEAPDSVDADGRPRESRSDCHAWGAHPIWFMQTGLAGIGSDAPFFKRVKIAPCPGGLAEIHARHPHPQGWITVDLYFVGNTVCGQVSTPVPGVFTYGSRTVALKPGVTDL